MRPSSGLAAVLAVDSGSPLVSVAFGAPGAPRAHRALAIAHSSEALLRAIDEVLDEAGATVREVDGLVGLRGPGSFTGLRVGLATLLGLHQALAVPATALPTLEVLAHAAGAGPEPLAAVVDALRGEWFVQLFAAGRARGPASIVPAAELGATGARRIVGHGLDGLAAVAPGIPLVEAGELAPHALASIAERPPEWSPATLLEPLYLRPPAVHGAG